MTQSPQPLALLDQPLDGALGEVADQPVDRDAPAVDHHPRLAGRHEDGPSRRRPARPRRSSSATDILPIAQSVPTVRITRLPGPCRRPTPSPSGPAGAGSRRSSVPRAAAAAANSGSSPRNVWSPDRMSRPAAIASRIVGRQRVGELAAGRGDPDQQRVGRAREGERLVEGRDDRDVVLPARNVADVPAGVGRIEQRDDVVAPVADHADGGLARRGGRTGPRPG